MINKLYSNKRGFTLIELIVVIAILLVLVTIAVPKFMGQTKKAEVAKHTASAKTLEDAVNIYQIEKGDFPRLTDVAYSSTEIEAYAGKIYDLTGKEANLDPAGNYYDLDYIALKDYVKIPNDSDKGNYILQNPVGKVFFLENLTEEAKNRADYTVTNPNSEEKVEIVYSEEVQALIKEGYMPVSTAKDLDDVRKNLGGKYIQVNDIDLSDVAEFKSIGYDTSSSFTGIYDGGGFTISNLSIYESGRQVGLFAVVSGGSVKNIGLLNVDIEADQFVGAITGRLEKKGTISNSYSTGLIHGNGCLGGLVGTNVGGTIINSYSASKVVGDIYLGGFVGWGSSDSVITNCYSLGDVTGTSQVGGFAGYSNINNKITNSYSIGKVTATGTQVGGFIGYNGTTTTITNSYYDRNTSTKSTSAGGTGLTTAQMKQQSNYTTWDFINAWKIEPNNYPTLR